MPNIVIIGNGKKNHEWPHRSSEDLGLYRQVANVLHELKKGSDAVITEIDCSDCTEIATGKKAPYLIVRDTDEKRGEEIAKALNQELNIDVELELLKAFFPRK